MAQARPRTILFVTNTGEYGGAEKHLLELLRRFIGSGVRLSILCLANDLYSEHLTQDEAAQINIIRDQGRLDSFRDWYRVFRDFRPDVVVFIRAWLWCYRWYVPIAAWLAGIPRRISIAHLTPPPLPAKRKGGSIFRIIHRLGRMPHLLTLRMSAYFQNATICVSNAIRDALIRDYQFPANSTITIYNGISLAEFDGSANRGLALRTRLALNPQEFLLVSIARLNEQKRIDILLLAISQLIRDGVSCKCVIVGDGPLREELLEQALELGLTGYVFFEGFRQDTRDYLQAATAFVLSSDREGLPLAILEAMACGLPCIVTNVGGNAELVTDHVHGLVIPAGSPDQVAAAVSYLVTHPRELAEMSKAARARAREEFEIEDRMAQIKSLLLK